MPKNQDDNAINRYIRKRILEARTNANENQEQLAKKLNKSRVAISDMERGKTAINAALLVQIAHHYKKSITYFYPTDTVIQLSALEEELIELFKELPPPDQYAHIDYIKQQNKNIKERKENMSYIKNNLMPNEKILYTAQVNPFIFLAPVISFTATCFFLILFITTKNQGVQIQSGIIIATFLFVGIRLGLEATIIILTTELAITNKRIIAKKGFIHRTSLEMLLQKVESIHVYQNIAGRILNFGTITIIGTGGTREKFRAIIDPEKVKKNIYHILEKIQAQNQSPNK